VEVKGRKFVVSFSTSFWLLDRLVQEIRKGLRHGNREMGVLWRNLMFEAWPCDDPRRFLQICVSRCESGPQNEEKYKTVEG